MNNMEKYLPIGTVAMLKNGRKRVMITGFAATAPETKGRMYDYMGCLYPEGVISSDKNILFDHEQIDKIYHMGLIDDEWEKVEAKIKVLVEQKLSASEEVVSNEAVAESAASAPTSDDMFKVNTDVTIGTPAVQEQPKPEVSSSDMFRVNTDVTFGAPAVAEPATPTPSSENMFKVNTDVTFGTPAVQEQPKAVPSSENIFRVNTDLFK